MRRLRRRLVLVVVAALGLSLLLIGLAAAFLDEDDYRRLLVAAARYGDLGTLEVAGDVRLDLGLNPAVELTRAELVPPGGPLRKLAGDRVRITFAGASLLRGHLRLRGVEGTGIRVDVDGSGKPGQSEGRISVPLAEEVRLRDVTVSYAPGPPRHPVVIAVSRLDVSRPSAERPVSLAGDWTIGGTAYRLTGEVSAPGASRTSPVVLRVESDRGSLALRGDIDWRHERAHLELTGESKSLSANLRDVGLEAPDLGPLFVTGTVTGDETALSLTDLKVRLGDGDRVRLDVTGSVDLALGASPGLSGTALHFEGTIADEQLLARLIDRPVPAIASARFGGDLGLENDHLRADGLVLSLAGHGGVKLSVKGSVQLTVPRAHEPVRLHALDVKVTSGGARAEWLDPLLPVPPSLRQRLAHLAESGWSGGFRLTGEGDGAYAVQDLRLEVGRGAERVVLSGRLGATPSVVGSDPIRDADLTIEVQAGDVARLGESLGFALPPLGAGTAHARLTRSPPDWRLRVDALDLGEPGVLVASASGEAKISPEAHGLAITVERSSLALHAPSAGRALARLGLGLRPAAELGPLSARASVTGPLSNLRLQVSRLRVGAGSPVVLDASGSASLAVSDAEVRWGKLGLAFTMRSDGARAALALFGRTVPGRDIGPLSVRGRLGGTAARPVLRIEQAEVGGHGLMLLAEGRIDARRGGGRPLAVDAVDLEVRIDADSARAAGALADLDVPELGALRATARLRGRPGILVLDDVDARLDGSGWRLSGKGTAGNIDHVLAGDYRGIAMDLELQPGSSLAGVVRAFGTAPPAIGTISGRARLVGEGKDLALRGVEVRLVGSRHASVSLAGSVRQVRRGAGVDLEADLDIPDPRAVAERFASAFPPLAPLRGHAAISGEWRRPRLDADLRLGDTALSLVLGVDLTAHRPRLEGTVAIPVLHPVDLGWSAARPGLAPGRPVFGRAPLDLSPLDRADLSLAFDVGEIVGAESHLGRVRGKVRLDAGRLRLEPVSFSSHGGKVEAAMVLDAAVDPPRLRVSAEGKDVGVGSVLSTLTPGIDVDGRAHLRLGLEAAGRSPHELASDVSGRLGLAVENASMPRSLFDLLTVDYLGWVLSELLPSNRVTLDCVVLHLEAKRGVVQVEEVVSMGSELSLTGKGEVDLGAETVDVTLYPRKRSQLFSSAGPVRIHGPLRAPAIEPPPPALGLAASGVQLGLGLYGAPLIALGHFAGLLGEHGGKRVPCVPATSTTSGSAPK